MKISDFHYEVPPEQIALEPITPRSMAKLLVYSRKAKEKEDSSFKNLASFLKKGDLLVFNTSYVVPARFTASKLSGAKLEGLLVQSKENETRVWIRGRVSEGEEIQVDWLGKVRVLEKNGKEAVLQIARPLFIQFLKTNGLIPIPPYIRAERERQDWQSQTPSDSTDYQTVFAEESRGVSVAAPTASLHFDQDLLDDLEQKGIERAEIFLHIGEGTFAPVEAEDLTQHQMHFEEVQITTKAWKKIELAKQEGRRVIAVGTTALRALESAWLRGEKNESLEYFKTDLFVKPPYRFNIVDGLITNFHWPDSTLMVLMATFLEAIGNQCGPNLKHEWRKLYEHAISLKYRFFSYGDGMLIL